MEVPVSKNGVLRFQIADIECRQPRALRELMLGDATAKDRLAAIGAEIVALRAQLTPEN